MAGIVAARMPRNEDAAAAGARRGRADNAGMFAITPTNSSLLLVDVQERFLPAIPAIASDQPCGRNCRILLEAAALLAVPVTISEQYPKGLGPTLPHLTAVAERATRLEKTHFSCGDDPAIGARLTAIGHTHVVVAGIEAHVCVLSTVADLLRRGLHVVVAGDAVASRRDEARQMALAAMNQLGALVVPTEAVVFRWQRQAGVGCFKQISALVK